MKGYDHDFAVIIANAFKIGLPFKFWLFLFLDTSFLFYGPKFGTLFLRLLFCDFNGKVFY